MVTGGFWIEYQFLNIFLSGIAPTSTSILGEGLILIYQQQAMSPNMYRPFLCDNTIYIV